MAGMKTTAAIAVLVGLSTLHSRAEEAQKVAPAEPVVGPTRKRDKSPKSHCLPPEKTA